MPQGFTRDGARRIVKATKHVEQGVRGLPPGRGRWPVIGHSALELVRAPAGGVPAKSGTTPGSATATHYTWDGTSLTLGSVTETIRNSYGAAVGADKDVWATRWAGALWVVTEACI